MRHGWSILLAIAMIMLSGCNTLLTATDTRADEVLHKSAKEVPEAELLDVWVEVFSPGSLPEDKEEAAGLSLEIREAEARYIPVKLRDTMEKTGYWGAVRVVPQGNQGAELLVRGSIIASDGEYLKLNISAVDASGHEWFNRDYNAVVTVSDYQRVERLGGEVHQPLYNTIANDLAKYRATLSGKDISRIRQVAALRFAAELAPDAFAGYLQQQGDEYRITRLPAEDDPLFQRVNRIRDRDFLLVDTLNGHFDNFSQSMQVPYLQWRKTRLDEVLALRKVESESLSRKVLGVAAIVGAIGVQVLGGNDNSGAANVASSALLIGGVAAIKSGIDKGAETTIHRDAIAELGNSFASETQPLVIEVDGETHELTGSAEVQYKNWQLLMKRIYATETGLPVGTTTPEAGTTPAAPATTTIP